MSVPAGALVACATATECCRSAVCAFSRSKRPESMETVFAPDTEYVTMRARSMSRAGTIVPRRSAGKNRSPSETTSAPKVAFVKSAWASTVDAEMASRILHLLTALNRLGTTIIIATHDLSLIAATPGADMLRLDNGAMVDPTGSLRNPPRSAEGLA